MLIEWEDALKEFSVIISNDFVKAAHLVVVALSHQVSSMLDEEIKGVHVTHKAGQVRRGPALSVLEVDSRTIDPAQNEVKEMNIILTCSNMKRSHTVGLRFEHVCSSLLNQDSSNSHVLLCCRPEKWRPPFLISVFIDHLPKVRQLSDFMKRLKVACKCHVMQQSHLIPFCQLCELLRRRQGRQELAHLCVLARLVSREDSLALERDL